VAQHEPTAVNTRADALKRPYRPARLGPEVITPLSGPAHVHGPGGVARARWRKPLPAIIADALANNRGIIARFRLGVLPPDVEDTSHCREVFDQLCRSTDAQIAALEAFAAINWRG